MKNVLITGGAGFIGSYLTSALVESGYNVSVLDNLSPQIHGNVAFEVPKGVIFHHASITDYDRVVDALRDVDVVFHLAAETGTGQSMYDIRNYVQVNEYGTAVLLEALSHSLSDRKIKLILASSRSIYGEGLYADAAGSIYHPDPREKESLSKGEFNFYNEARCPLHPVATSELCDPKPGSIYAASKYSQELLCKICAQAHENLELTILRFQNVYGAGQSLQNPYTGIISIFYNRIRQNLAINIYEDGLESRDFVYVTDVVDALMATLKRSKKGTLIANVGSGTPTSVSGLVDEYYHVLDKVPDSFVSGDFRMGDIRHNFADISTAQLELGFCVKVSLRNGLKKFVDWAENQPEYQDKSEKAFAELKSKGLGG